MYMFVLKKSFYTVLFIVLWHPLSSQIDIIASLMKPSGMFGYVFKPGFGLEFRRNPDDGNRIRSGLTGGVFLAKPRQEVFNTYTVEVANTTTIYSNPVVYSHFYVLMFGGFTEYKIFEKDFSPFVGIDGNINYVSYRLAKANNTYEYTTNDDVYLGIQPRVGISYKLSDNIILMAGFGKSMNINKNFMAFAHWKTYMCVEYSF